MVDRHNGVWLSETSCFDSVRPPSDSCRPVCLAKYKEMAQTAILQRHLGECEEKPLSRKRILVLAPLSFLSYQHRLPRG